MTNQMRRYSRAMMVLLLTAIITFLGLPNTSHASISSDNGSTVTYQAAIPPTASFMPGEVLVKFKSVVLRAQAQSAIASLGATQIAEIPQIALKRLKVQIGKEEQVLATLKENPLVEYAELNYITHISGEPNDPYYSTYQWNLPQVRIDSSIWNINTGSNDVRVAVIDTGIDRFHPDLQTNIVTGYNVLNPGANPDDDNGHGTHVAGIIAGIGNNGIGVAGMTWNVKIVPVKAFDSNACNV